MEPYKAKKLELNYNYSNDILKILNDTMEVYGEYKGYLKNMSYEENDYDNGGNDYDDYISIGSENRQCQYGGSHPHR